MPTTDHTEDCIAREHPDLECAAIEGDWNQPPGGYVQQATDELGEDVPWCQIQSLASFMQRTGMFDETDEAYEARITAEAKAMRDGDVPSEPPTEVDFDADPFDVLKQYLRSVAASDAEVDVDEVVDKLLIELNTRCTQSTVQAFMEAMMIEQLRDDFQIAAETKVELL